MAEAPIPQIPTLANNEVGRALIGADDHISQKHFLEHWLRELTTFQQVTLANVARCRQLLSRFGAGTEAEATDSADADVSTLHLLMGLFLANARLVSSLRMLMICDFALSANAQRQAVEAMLACALSVKDRSFLDQWQTGTTDVRRAAKVLKRRAHEWGMNTKLVRALNTLQGMLGVLNHPTSPTFLDFMTAGGPILVPVWSRERFDSFDIQVKHHLQLAQTLSSLIEWASSNLIADGRLSP